MKINVGPHFLPMKAKTRIKVINNCETKSEILLDQ